MSITEKEFNRISDLFLQDLTERIEEHDKQGRLDVDLNDGVVSIEDQDTGAEIIINKHSPTRQIWLASLTHGGLHFDYHGEVISGEVTSDNFIRKWRLRDGRYLDDILFTELRLVSE